LVFVLPSGYSKVLLQGARALREVAAELRARAEREVDAPELWLTVRDVAGLAERLRESDDWGWQTGFGGDLSPADLGVLATLCESRGDPSPYRDDASDSPNAVAIATLHDFLTRYLDGDFEFEEIATYRSADDSPAR